MERSEPSETSIEHGKEADGDGDGDDDVDVDDDVDGEGEGDSVGVGIGYGATHDLKFPTKGEEYVVSTVMSSSVPPHDWQHSSNSLLNPPKSCIA